MIARAALLPAGESGSAMVAARRGRAQWRRDGVRRGGGDVGGRQGLSCGARRVHRACGPVVKGCEMALVFLCGGTGNQLFQLAASQPGDRFSQAFLCGLFPRVLGWSCHEQVLALPAPSRGCEWGALAMLVLDGLLARLCGRALFTSFDLRSLKARPLLGRWLQLGYFQGRPPVRDLASLADQLLGARRGPDHPAAIRSLGTAQAIDIAMHIRGGDILKLEAQGANPYGLLPADYFSRALAQALAAARAEGGAEGPCSGAAGASLGGGAAFPGVRSRHLTVFTDDRPYARALLARISPPIAVRIDDGPLPAMLAGCLAARCFIAGNSTLSWWIVQMRGADRLSISPAPFTRSLSLETPECGHALAVRY